jgi:hypothetical protein
VLAILGLIFAFDLRRIGTIETETAGRIMSPVIHAVLLLVVSGIAWHTSLSFCSFVRSNVSVSMLFLVIVAVFVGIMRGNSFELIRMELKIIGWVYGGYALFSLVLLSPRPKALLSFVAVGCAFMLVVSALKAPVVNQEGRVMGGVYWDYSSLSFAFLGLMYSNFSPMKPLRLLWYFAGVIIYAYFALFLGANRSDIIAFAIFGLCATVGFGKIGYSSEKGGILGRYSALKLGFGLACAVVLIALLGTVLRETVAVQRFAGTEISDGGLQSRFAELVYAYEDASSSDLFFGLGLGSTVRNVTGGQMMSYLHIAIFMFLMKFGLIPFLLIVAFLYVKIPLEFIRAACGSRSIGKARAEAILGAYPFVIGWLALTLMSGGMDWYSVLGLGMIWAAFHAKSGRYAAVRMIDKPRGWECETRGVVSPHMAAVSTREK